MDYFIEKENKMLTPHDNEIIGEIVDENTVEVVSAANTIYEQMCTKKPISKRDFYKEFEDNLVLFWKIFDENN